MSVRAIHDALIAALVAIDGDSPYHFDVSGTGRVTRAQGLRLDNVPCISCSLVDVPETDGPELGDYQETGNFQVFGLVAGATDDIDGRVQAAEDFLDDIRHALRQDRSLGGLVLELHFSATTMDGGELFTSGSVGVVAGMVTVTWYEDGTP